MREQLIQYVNLLFAGSPDTHEIRQEILQNTLDRYDDLISQGKSPEAAYRLAISGIGDINEILNSSAARLSPTPSATVFQEDKKPVCQEKKAMRAVAIGLYICCVIPLFVLGNIGNGIMGLCFMFLMIAAATALIILAGDDEKDEEEKPKEMPKTELEKALKTSWGWISLVIYLGISFWSGAWYITWLVFPIMGAIKGIIKACMDLKGAAKNES